ncbi:TetR/AcrR family transcriptional regulator [Microscilla marina]|uniref:Transcriptional regulator, TetR family, putative n=1 Tax=Microscilla marina ATCC 23134 TaxID=313606 RepID=A1ZQV9_MICM2|nr:TetR/AcrR family transcriptional regulator [Microscilla marina]EAY27264.1 transcriptional regulator, TetR family, putative [Microscilla marina ATCC 23134]
MASTKEKIVQMAIEIFNKKGIKNTTSRDIADALEISRGNLSYHYKCKTDLIEDVYKYIFESKEIEILPNGLVTLHHFHALFKQMIDFQDRYRFFFLDIIEILRDYPAVGKLYRERAHRRTAQGRALINYYIGSGLFQPEPIPGIYDQLSNTVWIVRVFWLNQVWIKQECKKDGTVAMDKKRALESIWMLHYPHLTDKGKVEYFEIMKLVAKPAS